MRGDFAFWVASGGGETELNGGFIFFVLLEENVGFFGHFAGEKN